MPTLTTDALDFRRRGRRPWVLAVLFGVLLLAAAGAAAAVLTASEASTAGARAPAAAGERADGVVDARTAAREGRDVADGAGEQVDPLAPVPDARPRVVAPAAGVASETPDEREAAAAARASAREELTLPKPKGAASSTRRQAGAPAVSDLSADTATALPNGVALPPLEAPGAVLQVIRAGNTIARAPYKWGGGHGNFQDNGYDCSGSVTYALYAAGLIEGSRTSGGLMTWGKPGKGRWITIYTNPGHVFMEVAGIRFDTSGRARTGSRWQNERRPTSGYVARHPPGL